MIPFDKCPLCEGVLKRQKVQKLLRGGRNFLNLHVDAEVCLNCGERLYAKELVGAFEDIRSKLKKQDVSNFVNLGQLFTVSENWQNKIIQPSI